MSKLSILDAAFSVAAINVANNLVRVGLGHRSLLLKICHQRCALLYAFETGVGRGVNRDESGILALDNGC